MPRIIQTTLGLAVVATLILVALAGFRSTHHVAEQVAEQQSTQQADLDTLTDAILSGDLS